MCRVAYGLDKTNYMDLAHDVYTNIAAKEDITKITNLKGYLFTAIVNHFKNSKTKAEAKYRADLNDIDLPTNDYINTDNLNKLTDFELEFIAVIMACEGNMLKVSKVTKISRGSCDKYKIRIFEKLK